MSLEKRRCLDSGVRPHRGGSHAVLEWGKKPGSLEVARGTMREFRIRGDFMYKWYGVWRAKWGKGSLRVVIVSPIQYKHLHLVGIR